jgi:hypothetical protein
MNILIENQILPPVSVFVEFSKADKIIIEKHDNYQKRTYRNRFAIATPKGKHIISLPLKKGKTRIKYLDVQISYDDLWITTMSNKLKSNYGSSAFFEHYYYQMIEIFNKKNKFLFDLNNELRNFVFNSLGIQNSVGYTHEYLKSYKDDIYDLRNKYTPLKANYIVTLKPYNQVFEDKAGFLPDLSIIDLLFNTGNYAAMYLVDQPSK